MRSMIDGLMIGDPSFSTCNPPTDSTAPCCVRNDPVARLPSHFAADREFMRVNVMSVPPHDREHESSNVTDRSKGNRAIQGHRTGGRLSRVAFAALLGGFLYGFTLAIVAGAEPFLVERFGLSSRQLGMVVSNLDLGAAIGALLAGPLSDRLGRRRVLSATALVFLLSAVVGALAPTVGVLLVGRMLAGLAVGAAMIVPLYVAEISPARARGFLVSLVQIGIVTGILAAYVTGWMAVDAGPENWRWMFASGVLPATILCLVILALPESPRWLAARGDTATAMDVLSSMMDRREATAELGSIEQAIRDEANDWSQLLTPRVRRAIVVGLMITMLSVVVGINAVIIYGPMILMEGAGESISAALLGGVALAAVNFVFSLIALVSVDRMGRKPLLLGGLAGMACAMFVLGSRFSLAASGTAQGLLSPILAFVAFYAVSLGPVTWVLVSEIFPTAARGAAMSLCMIVMYLADFVVTLTFPGMMDSLGRGVFYGYAVVCLLGGMLVLAFVPETKGKSLEQIQQLWSRGDDV
jgi:sugar porter (SP) family MFS transporter